MERYVRTMGMINRDDMLELTRRMTVKRNCFDRIAGAYMDEEGFIDGTFNQHFLNLTAPERDKNLKLAKAVPFAETNVQLKEYAYRTRDLSDDSMRKLLCALNESELKTMLCWRCFTRRSDVITREAAVLRCMYFTAVTISRGKERTGKANGNPRRFMIF